MNFRLIAVQLGDLLKYSTTMNEVDRLGGAIFRFQREHFANEAITSQRAQLIHDWVLSLAKQEMNPDERIELLVRFCHGLATGDSRRDVDRMLAEAGLALETIHRQDYAAFLAREFHAEVNTHCKYLFLQGNYFHAVFEACKAYNKLVKQKAQNTKDGAPLMLDVWGCVKSVLKITPCISQTDRDVQDGIMFLSAGLMQAIRNPTAHEPAILWPISRQDCLDILSLVSDTVARLQGNRGASLYSRRRSRCVKSRWMASAC